MATLIHPDSRFFPRPWDGLIARVRRMIAACKPGKASDAMEDAALFAAMQEGTPEDHELVSIDEVNAILSRSGVRI